MSSYKQYWMHSLRSKKKTKPEADGVEEKVSKEDNNLQLLGEAKSVKHDIIDVMAIHSSDQLGLDERVAMLNGDQRTIYGCVMNHLHHHKQHDDGDCHCDIKPHFDCLSVALVVLANPS